MQKKTIKQKKQEEEYLRRMRKIPANELFGDNNRGDKKPLHVNKMCSECGHHWAWYSSDFGETWQCSKHRKQ
jgi:hypothetical protein